MFKQLSNWWNADKIRAAAIDAKFDELKHMVNVQKASIAKAEEELAESKSEIELYRARDERDEAKRNGKDPWVEIKSADYSDVKGIQIELDWNPAFIEYLKENGIKGTDEDATVQKWLAFMYHDMSERLEQKTIDQSDKKRVNDFE